MKTVLMACLPILCCLVYCGMQGKSIGEVYLPGSEWNDELFYFKQVEGIVHYGYPQGYYGFNESHALKLSFAAWSPVLVFPWVLWGLLFGWNLLSPIICNIVLLTVAMIVFVWLVKPTWRQLGILTLLFCLYRPFVRYMLSGMPEIICFSMLIIFYGVAIHYVRTNKLWGLVTMLTMASVMSLMRPYFLLFLLLPLYLWVRRSKWWGVAGSAVLLMAVGGSYVWINRYLGAEYFTPLFFTDWITAFFQQGIGGGIHHFFGKLYWMGRDFLGHLLQGFRTGLASGAFFAGYLITMAILLWQTGSDFLRQRKANREQEKEQQKKDSFLIIEAHLALCFVAMLFALLLMYKLTEGSKHLLTFMAAGLFIISLMRTRFFKKAMLLGAAFAFFYSYMAVSAYDYQVPFVEQELQESVEQWQEAMSTMPLIEENVPNYENVVIWVFPDIGKENGRALVDRWQLLYGLPEGMGISCCQYSYVMENLDTLNSRYIAAPAASELDKRCEAAGYGLIHRDEEMALYARY